MVFKLLSAVPALLGLKTPNMTPAVALYDACVSQARLPVLYTQYAVPDTVEGRFDLVTLHVFLVLHRIKEDGAKDRFPQRVFDAMFKDMDYSLREMGVGDIKVGGKVRELAERFYGRSTAYGEAMEAGDVTGLTDALSRNVYDAAAAEGASRLAAYAMASAESLRNQSADALRRGEVLFPDPLEVSPVAA